MLSVEHWVLDVALLHMTGGLIGRHTAGAALALGCRLIEPSSCWLGGLTHWWSTLMAAPEGLARWHLVHAVVVHGGATLSHRGWQASVVEYRRRQL